jgi:hypothetical protein
MSDTQRFIGDAVDLTIMPSEADMSDTPRTDSATHGFVQLNPQKTDIDMWEISCVDADFARELERENAVLRKVLSRIMAGGNHLACIIGNHPPYGTDYDIVLKHYLPHHPEKYDAWCCWNAIMLARDEIEAFDKEMRR